MLLRSSSSVSNSLAARASSSSSGRQDLLLHLAHGDLDRSARAVAAFEGDVLLVAGGRSHERRLELTRQPTRAELDDRVALCFAGRIDEIDHERVALAGRTAVRGSELGDRLLQRLELRVDRLGGHVGLDSRHLQLRPVTDLGERLHLDRRVEAPARRRR